MTKIKKGDTVTILHNAETELWGIASCQGYVEYSDPLDNLYVRVPKYPAPFVLRVEDVQLITDKQEDD